MENLHLFEQRLQKLIVDTPLDFYYDNVPFMQLDFRSCDKMTHLTFRMPYMRLSSLLLPKNVKYLFVKCMDVLCVLHPESSHFKCIQFMTSLGRNCIVKNNPCFVEHLQLQGPAIPSITDLTVKSLSISSCASQVQCSINAWPLSVQYLRMITIFDYDKLHATTQKSASTLRVLHMPNLMLYLHSGKEFITNTLCNPALFPRLECIIFNRISRTMDPISTQQLINYEQTIIPYIVKNSSWKYDDRFEKIHVFSPHIMDPNNEIFTSYDVDAHHPLLDLDPLPLPHARRARAIPSSHWVV
jgi:hypothetical protein